MARARTIAAVPLALDAAGLSLAGCVTAGPTATTAPAESFTSRKLASAPASAPVVRLAHRPRTTGTSFDGIASYYSEGMRVASGARFDPHALTAAHPSLPFGTRLKVSDPKTGKSVIVTVNDRGPFVHGRVLDLSVGAARALGIESRGVNRVHADILSSL